MTPELNKKLHTLLSQTKLMDEKANLVMLYTSGKFTSTKDMTNLQASQLIDHLASMVPTAPKRVKEFDHEFAAKNKMRNKMLAIGYDMKWDVSDKPEHAGLEKAAICRDNVDAWCRSKRSLYKKGLYDMSIKELASTISQFELVKRAFLRSIAK